MCNRRHQMESFRDKGYYYDVPADDISLEVKEGMDTPAYEASRYMRKQREMAAKSTSKLKQEKYGESRYAGN